MAADGRGGVNSFSAADAPMTASGAILDAFLQLSAAAWMHHSLGGGGGFGGGGDGVVGWSGPLQLPPPSPCSRGWRRPRDTGRGASPTKSAAPARRSRGSSRVLMGRSGGVACHSLWGPVRGQPASCSPKRREATEAGSAKIRYSGCLSHSKLHKPTSTNLGHCLAVRNPAFLSPGQLSRCFKL